jgi:hypothetical protein
MKEQLSFAQIEEILRKAVECAEYYQREYFNNKMFTLYLANGEKVKYTISPANIPHLLGIDLFALKDIIKLEGEDLVSRLKDLETKAYELSNKFRVGLLKQEDVFSDYIYQKLENFKYNFKSDVPALLAETQFVCHYKSSKSWEVTTKNQKYDYIIVKKLDNDKIALLCLKKQGRQCIAVSSQIPDSDEKSNEILKDLITNQEITMVTGMEVYNIYTESKYSRNLLPAERITKSRGLKKYEDKYNSHINISSEYEHAVSKLGNNSEERYENKTIIESIVNAIANRKLIPVEEYKDSILINLINGWNDHICRCENTNEDEVQLSYTEAIKELTKFRELATSLEVENRKLQENIGSLTKANIELTRETEEQRQIIDNVYQIVKPRTN